MIGQNIERPNLGPIGSILTLLRRFLIHTARLRQDFEATTQPRARG